jgi:hypothetical protein
MDQGYVGAQPWNISAYSAICSIRLITSTVAMDVNAMCKYCLTRNKEYFKMYEAVTLHSSQFLC